MNTSTDLALLPHWMDGKRTLSTGNRFGPVFNPATGPIARHVAYANAADVDIAVRAAQCVRTHGATLLAMRRLPLPM